MVNKKIFSYMVLIGLGFIAAIAVGLFVFIKFRELTINYNKNSKDLYEESVDYLKKTTLAGMAEHIEVHYPEFYDTALLKEKAGSDWFWEKSADLNKISELFHFAYIYYIEKKDDNYIFLMSSNIQKDENPEWLGKPVWKEAPPLFIEEAWNTKQVSFSEKPAGNEQDHQNSPIQPKLISSARPIISDGEVVGILGIDYHTSFLDEFFLHELYLKSNEDALMQKMRNILIFSIIAIIGFMGYQIWLSTATTMVHSKELESDKRTRLMLDATPMICSIWDTEGNLIDCNQETLNIFNIENKSECLKRYYDFIPEYQPDGVNSRSIIRRHSKEVAETGYKRFEWMYCTGTGEPLPVEITLVRVPWKKTWRIACYARDLRETRAKEEAAQESESRIRVMLDSMVFSCLFWDSDLNLTDCNQRTVDLFGYGDKEEILGKFDMLSPEYQSDGRRSDEKAREVLTKAFETGKMVFQWEHRKKDGTPLPAEVSLIRVDWKDSYRIVAYIRDLSNLVETEVNLKRVSALVEASPNMTMYLGAKGNIEFMNPSVSTLTGFSPEELRKDGLRLIFSPGDLERLNKVYIAAALNKLLASFEMTIITRNGGKREISFSVMPVVLYDGCSGVGLIGRDITDLKLMQRDFEVAKDQAERALASEIQYNKAKSDFLSRVSHELRTPLNAIIGITNKVKNYKHNNGLNQCCADIYVASEHLLGLVNDILDMTGLDTDRFCLLPKPFSFSRMIGSVIDHVTQMTKVKNQAFITDIDNKIHEWLVSDERRIKQVIMNLLSNAVKFTPEKGIIQLSARMLKKDDHECSIRFEVIDNGIGISSEVIERLGQTFEQADNSITREHGGMGLGLSLTKRIVELLQGELWIESQPGKGSRFSCEVHFGIAREPERIAEGTGESGTMTGNDPGIIDLAEKRILVVDDVEVNRDILFAILEDTRAILDGASNGEEAVRMFSQHRYDLVLMDLHMPRMDGYTATRNIRASSQPWARNIPIISVSAETSTEVQWKCIEAGINEHLAKPVEMQTLYGSISRCMPGLSSISAPLELTAS